MQSRFRAIAAIVLIFSAPAVLSQPPRACRVEPFQGAALPQGAVAHMHVVNSGAACTITLFGVPGERRNPAESGSITTQPAHGSAAFVAPQALYTPAKGFVGDDEFTLEALAKGNNVQQSVRLKVRVVVRVVAP